MVPKAKESVYMDISMHNRRIRPIKHLARIPKLGHKGQNPTARIASLEIERMFAKRATKI
jgi:hypothetical protein